MRFVFGFLVLALDFFSKSWINNSLPLMTHSYPYGGIGVFQNWHGIEFSIVHTINKGAAWGVFGSFQYTLLIFRIAVIGYLIFYLFFSNKEKWRQLPLILIIAGAIGNVIDFFRFGHVVDFFYFVFWGYSYPVFNVADSAIFCGIVWLVLHSLLTKHRHAKT